MEEEEEEKQKVYKIIVFGEDGSGKTTMLQTLAAQKTDQYGSASLSLTNIEVDSVTHTIEFVDAPGCEKYMTRLEEDVPGADGFILVYSIASRETFLNGKKLLPYVWKYRDEKKFPLVVVGNKLDLESERVVRRDDGCNLAVSWYGAFMEISALDREQVMKVFVQIIREILKPEEPKSEPVPENVKKKGCCSVI